MKLRLIIIFVFGLFAIPHCEAQDTTWSNTFIINTSPEATTAPAITQSALPTDPPVTTPPTTQQPPTTTPPPPSSPVSIFTSAMVETTMTSPIDETTDSSFTGPTITDITTTTKKPPSLPTIFECDFTGPCFGSGVFDLTYGYQFNPSPLTNASEPPRAPTSDAISITNPTTNNEVCKLPFKPQLDGSTQTTTWDMWFCYNNECPTTSGGNGQCAVDQYGLIPLAPTESSKTVIDSLTPNVSPRDASSEQCLRFYYYFTVYDGADWGQQIELMIRSNNGTVQTSIGTLTVNDMKDNKWNLATIPFSRQSLSDTLEITFMVLNDNRPQSAATNRTINFAMDVVRLYNYNCSYVEEMVDGVVRPTSAPPGDKPNLGLILGLSLGIGIPVLLLLVSGLIYYCKIHKNKPKVAPVLVTGDRKTVTDAIVNIPLIPVKQIDNNTAVTTAEF